MENCRSTDDLKIPMNMSEYSVEPVKKQPRMSMKNNPIADVNDHPITVKARGKYMPNLTLHPLWHTVMPLYQHVIGVCTHALSALAFYLMLTKTPKAGRLFARYLMLLQASVTLVDLNFGFLACPIVLYPLPGVLCNGVLCTVFGASGHIGNMLMNLLVSYVAVAQLYCYHYKFVTILSMAKHRTIPEKYNVVFRVAIFIIYSILSFVQLRSSRNIESGPEYTRLNYPSLYYLFENSNYRTLVYDPSVFDEFSTFYMSVMILNSSISEKTRSLQKSAMITLVLQSTVVVIILCVPIAVYGYIMPHPIDYRSLAYLTSSHTIIGIPANIAMLYLTVFNLELRKRSNFRTPETFKIYSKILCISALCDLIGACILPTLIPRDIFFEDADVLDFHGFCTFASVQSCWYFTGVIEMMIALNDSLICVSFYHRLKVVYGNQPTIKRTYLTLFVVLLLHAPLCFGYIEAFRNSHDIVSYSDDAELVRELSNLTHYAIIKIADPLTLTVTGWSFTSAMAFFFMALYFRNRTISELMNTKALSAATRNSQLMFVRALNVQLLILICFFTGATAYSLMFFGVMRSSVVLQFSVFAVHKLSQTVARNICTSGLRSPIHPSANSQHCLYQTVQEANRAQIFEDN
ncbi:sri-71 [Pristionchus pacificus]|uniref:Sri-71 n=1 Tax=Pristionchus pacificus TaxID=54126 RepID=A0A2A6CP62_PRIPA|nr:sri-71 [Pristionchus pacificus]|eukprot:PDM79843.1 sri-71 [Pristionchus pacificus]